MQLQPMMLNHLKYVEINNRLPNRTKSLIPFDNNATDYLAGTIFYCVEQEAKRVTRP